MGEIYYNGCMYDYIYNLYVYNNFWNYNQNTAYLQYMTHVVCFVLHCAHQLLQTATTIDHQLWPIIAFGPLPFLGGTIGHTCTFVSNGTSGTALLIIDM
jgi:hypothetical protein